MGVSQGCVPSGVSGRGSHCPSCPPVVAGIPGLLDASVLFLPLPSHGLASVCLSCPYEDIVLLDQSPPYSGVTSSYLGYICKGGHIRRFQWT